MRVRDAVALVALCGCAQVDVVAERQPDAATVPDARVPDPMTGGSGARDAGKRDTGIVEHDAATRDAAEDAAMALPPCTYGANTPPAIAIGALAHAVCSCDSITSSDVLTTDGVDPNARGDVGVNGEMSVESTSLIDGSLSVAGSGGLHLADNIELEIRGDLGVDGPLEGTLASVRVGRNAGVAGRIDLGSLFVTGSLTQPAGTERRIGDTSEIGNSLSQGVVVPSPCDCADSALFDTAALVRARAPLAEPWPSTAAPVRCAEYALPDGEVAGFQIALSEPAAVYVPGDLHVTGDLVIDSEAGAAIDLFVAGDVRIDGRLRIGSSDGQGPVRIYVGGGGTVQVSGGGEAHGVLYAPRAELVLSAPLALRGALFMRRIAASAALTVHYDRGIR